MWRKAVYFAFGRALGRMGGQLVNTHGAGAQRCDPKAGNPGDYPNGLGEQHDLVRIYNHVRLVRGGNAPAGMNSPQPMEGRSGSLRLRVQPNPASGVIGVQFEMPVRSEARLTVHDPRGRLVRDLLHDVISPGTLRVNWDGTDASGRRVPSGTYFVRLRALGESWSAPAVTVP
jgi:hypothetical protein